MRQVDRTTVLTAMDDDADPWYLANAAPYRLCADHRSHTEVRASIAKVFLIGRTYAAAIERRKKGRGGSEVLSDSFYVDAVGPAFRRSEIDQRLAAIPLGDDIGNTWMSALEAHAHLLGVIRALTGDEKRSLASKYLHFHRPELFFIYDSRAAQSIARLSKGFKRSARRCPAGVDATYGAFVVRALEVHDCIFDNHGKRLMPRQLDRVLLQIAALS
jgi:hypothetical protein